MVLACLPKVLAAGEGDWNEWLKRIHPDGAAEFRYEETRTLELASAPLRSSGYMLLGAEGSLVKLQVQPKRIVMAISAGRMLYWDAALKQRHAVPISQGGPVAQQIDVFRALLLGQVETLKPNFNFVAETHGKHWFVRMSPKPAAGDDEAPSVEVYGDQDLSKHTVLIRQPDGETTEYRMEKTSPEHSLAGLLAEAAGE
jgi:hypothetical protein